MQMIIADDDLVNRCIVGALLTASGHQVLEAPDGEVAWALLQSTSTSFLITDWQMPQLDGLDLIRRIRAANLPSYTYIILLTSRHSKADIVAGFEAGADDYLLKPFHPEELCARVRIGEGKLMREASS